MSIKRARNVPVDVLPAFARIDGRHPYKDAVPRGAVEYRARRLHGGRVVFFNFALAREMGLIPADHPDRLTATLSRSVLHAFSLQIINEYDEEQGTPIPEEDVLPHSYMATRYLQLQHGDRIGRQSGDGRSVWNGTHTHGGVTWDLSSCGTGVTRLCPATAETQQFFKTGNWEADYGCGTATLQEGLIAALMSETFHRNGVATERVLAVIQQKSGFCINVRAGRNLLRPSHFFVHLKQSDLESLRARVDAFIDRQVANGDWPGVPRGRRRYVRFAEESARTFARLAATFESEYIFCWLDWDGDNILADGGIIDYGSVRQFGLYHREYRFDDGPRYSTSIPEQRSKARYIVQNFAQIRDYLLTGTRRPRSDFDADPILDLFDDVFERTKIERLLHHVGFEPDRVPQIVESEHERIEAFRKAHAWFERARSARGPVPVEDGINWNAIYSTRDLLRELPRRLITEPSPLPSKEILEIALSSFATEEDREPTPHRRWMAGRFQRAYLDLVEAAARRDGRPLPELLGDLARRASVIDRYDRVTGDSAIYATRKLIHRRHQLGPEGIYRTLDRFVTMQTVIPERAEAANGPAPRRPDVRRALDGLLQVVRRYRHGL